MQKTGEFNKMVDYAPVVIFVYKRPFHVEKLLDSLSQCKEAKFSDIIIFSDGPKNGNDLAEISAIEDVRRVCSKEDRFNSVKLIAHDKNQGLANSIIQGVSSVIKEFGKVIVLEDDLIVSPHFLTFMNEALVKFENDPTVGQIGACNFFACGEKFPEAFFIPIPDCLGWATWRKNWEMFTKDTQLIFDKLEEDKNLTNRFNGYGSYDFVGLLKSNVQKQVDSWAILWHATCMLNNWLTLYPNPSLTNHIESVEATHANVNIIPPLAKDPISLENIEIKELSPVIQAMKLGYSGNGDYFGKRKRSSLWSKLKGLLRK